MKHLDSQKRSNSPNESKAQLDTMLQPMIQANNKASICVMDISNIKPSLPLP